MILIMCEQQSNAHADKWRLQYLLETFYYVYKLFFEVALITFRKQSQASSGPSV